ncbi:MAG TPA: hypothetical protein VGL61_30295 [Kofleriaceae bacterium]|jgi:hypothetical protein
MKLRPGLGFSAVLAVAACSTSNITSIEYGDVAASVAGSTTTDVVAMADVVAIARGAPPAGFTYAAGDVCGSRGELGYSYTITCKDTAGTVLDACDATTDTADVTYTWAGAVDFPNLAATITREGIWAASQLQTQTARFDGNATLVDDDAIEGSAYHLDATATYTGVTLDVASRQATGGSIALDIDATIAMPSGADAFALTAAVSLAGGSASIMLDQGIDYTSDLATGAITSAGSP